MVGNASSLDRSIALQCAVLDWESIAAHAARSPGRADCTDLHVLVLCHVVVVCLGVQAPSAAAHLHGPPAGCRRTHICQDGTYIVLYTHRA